MVIKRLFILLMASGDCRVKSSNRIFPFSLGGLLVYHSESSGRRTFFRYSCQCGKLGRARSDSSLFKRGNCGMCFNNYTLVGNECHIDVKNSVGDNLVLKVDADDVGRVNRIVLGSVWFEKSTSGRCNYGYCSSRHHSSGLFHRVLLDVSADKVVDHIDGDGLNCTRNNLRVVDKGENNRNLPRFKTNTTGAAGVSRSRYGGYRSYIWKNGGQVNLGRHDDFFNAVCARKSAEVRFGYHLNHGRDKNKNES